MTAASGAIGLAFAMSLGVGPGVAVAAGSVGPDTLGAIRGKVVDSAGAPIDGAEILLPALSRSAYSNRQGQFTISMVPAGRQQLVARMVGFEAAGAEPVVAPGDTTRLTLTLRRSAIVLPEVRVATNGPAVRPKLRLFEERRRAGLGHFYTQEAIEAHEHETIATLLRLVPRVAVVVRGGQIAVAANRAGTIRLPAYRRPWPSKCYLQVYLDGILVWRPNTGDDLPFDLSQVPLTELAGIEVYSPGQTPIELGGTGAACGTIVLWTR